VEHLINSPIDAIAFGLAFGWFAGVATYLSRINKTLDRIARRLDDEADERDAEKRHNYRMWRAENAPPSTPPTDWPIDKLWTGQH
jgi:hypothetical protein